MGIYVKVVSTIKEIQDMKVRVENNTKDISSVWAFVNGLAKQIYPEYVLNLTGAQKFDDNVVFPPGRYVIDMAAGASVRTANSNNNGQGGAFADEVVQIDVPFMIRAYCGSKGDTTAGGVNPYSGPYKVDAVTTAAAVPAVNHIFGNAGSACYVPGLTNGVGVSSGNCLGNGAFSRLTGGTGAGSCLHFIPVEGTFGVDYLYAFHCTAGTPIYSSTSGSDRLIIAGGVGSAYGGAGSAAAFKAGSYTVSSQAGGSTPYGDGGTGITPTGTGIWVGNAGTGIGAGFGGASSAKVLDTTMYYGQHGAAAKFNGLEWVSGNQHITTENINGDGYIRIRTA